MIILKIKVIRGLKFVYNVNKMCKKHFSTNKLSEKCHQIITEMHQAQNKLVHICIQTIHYVFYASETEAFAAS